MFKTESEIREHARQAFESGAVRLAPIHALLASQGWFGIKTWYNEYDIASGNPNPFTGDEEPTGKK